MRPSPAAGRRTVLNRAELLGDATLFSQNIDLPRDAMLFVRYSREDYRRASFLDGRMLTAQSQGSWENISAVRAILQNAAPIHPVHFIFHTGHVGSTLLSRLLEELPGVLSLREPLPLRLLAEAGDNAGEPDSLLSAEGFDTLLRDQIVLWSRGFADTRAVIVKATSSAARLAPALLDATPQARAIYLNLKLEPYLATLLAGENSILDLRGHAGERMRRFKRFGGASPTALWTMGAGELAGLAWLTETLTHAHLQQRSAARVLAVDFDELLSALSPTLARICAHLALSAPAAFLDNVSNSPALRRYAKSPDIAYSPAMRASLLNQARQQQRDEIAKGQAWVKAALARTPALEKMLPSSALA